MDVEALVLLSHMKVRLERLTRNPSLVFESDPMAIPNFQGLVGAMDKLEFTLEAEAVKLHGDIASLGDRGIAAIGKGREKMAAVGQRIAQVESFVSKLEGSNGGPLDSSATSSEAEAAPPPGPNGGPRIL